MLGQQGKTGFMLLMGIILRPPLMVIGFFISILLMGAVGKGIGLLIAIMLEGLLAGRIVGLVTAIVMMIIITVFMVAIAHKIFALVTWLPDNAMKWMGQQVQNLGEAGETRQAGNVIAGHVNTAGFNARQMQGPSKGKDDPGKKPPKGGIDVGDQGNPGQQQALTQGDAGGSNNT